MGGGYGYTKANPGNFLTDNNTWNSQEKMMAFILFWSISVILMIHFQKMHLSDVRK